MKNSNSHKTTKSPVRQITKFAVLSVIVFLAISCNLNAGGKGNTEEAVKILTGACGETAETEGVEVLPLNGNKYYFKEEYYYRYPDYAPQDFKDRIKNEKLFREIVADRWNEWIVGIWTMDRVFTKEGEYIYNGNRGGRYEINPEGAYYYYRNPMGEQKDIILSVIPQKKYYFDILDITGRPVHINDNGVADLQGIAYQEFVSKEMNI